MVFKKGQVPWNKGLNKGGNLMVLKKRWSYITKWISGTVTDAQVLGGIQAWIQSR